MNTHNVKAPLSIKGANAPINATPVVKSIAVNLDWCRYSKAWDTTIEQADNLRIAVPRFASFQLTGEMLQNGKGYDSAMALTIGVIHWHSKRPEQGISVELTGSALGQSRNSGVTDLDLLQHIASIVGMVSTMDSAIDVYNYGADFHDIILLDEAGSLETTVRDVNEFKGRRKVGETITPHGGVYVGSPKSPRQIKIYDKAAEQGQHGKDWTRIEMRWRGKHARAAHSAMLKFGIASVTQKAVKTMLNADIEWYQEAVNGDPAIIEPVRRPETNTDDWLIDLVAPVLERQLQSERSKGGTRLFERFNAVLQAEYTARGSKAARERRMKQR